MTSQVIRKPDFQYENFHGIVTVSPEMKKFISVLQRVARTDASVLLRGETGTGKELVASAIHLLSRRSRARFEAINCATLTPDLLASELFGHMKGAFTGAVRDKKGLFLMADGGTLFLDEVAEMPLEIQARFLRVLQDKTFTPVGSVNPIQVDVRVIAATNKSLRRMVEQGLFREDLMYRIRVVPLFLPRLVDREGDVEALTWYFIEQENQKGFRQIRALEKQVMEAFKSYPWFGNVRELKNNIEYAYAIGEGDVLRFSELTPELRGEESPSSKRVDQKTEVDIERERILNTLNEVGGRKGRAAEKLGMSRSTLWRKLREHRIIR
ncbi:MAG: sigma-54-dependent Fis family transcriptional regulator [Pseudobdellovibrionaceae bacterium]|nr:sigma-54-dependent Fis family transcriptional regulator [Bdellovibrionales bacterium]USN47691.1 MAG: sigma-54-dependent Fis family transcriptional regulator [Pseudobdellovibrionaceae bacterium]